MTEICFAPGPTDRDVAEALRCLSPRLAADTPVLALGGVHAADAGQAVFASLSVMRLFGATTLAGLSKQIAEAKSTTAALPAAERLNQLAETLPLDGPAKLEPLRFELDGAKRPLTFLCRRLTVAGAPPLFLAAALDIPRDDFAGRRAVAVGEAASQTVAASPRVERFLWRTDAEHRIVEIGPQLVGAIGDVPANFIGRGFAAAVARGDAEKGAEFDRLLERKESFSGVGLNWPIMGSNATVPVTMAGLADFDQQRGFLGFRGFGLIDVERLAAAREALAARSAVVAAAHPPEERSAGALQPWQDSRRTDFVRAAELRHYQREARELHAILDTAMDGVAVLDAEGRIVALNRSGEALFCYDKAEVAGEPFTILLAPESRERAQSYFDGLRSNGVMSLLNDGREILGLTRQGGTIPIFMTLGKVGAGGDGGSEQDQRYCALLRDMTHWKKVERELEEARREAERVSALKSDFLAKISHEIRTPLNAILGFAEVIMEERFGPIGNERYKDYLKDIHSSGALVMSLVNDLLDLSKIEAGKMELSFASVDANRIVTECVSIMQPQASTARVIIRLSLAPQLPHIFADERSLRQIVLNLLSNAIKFTQGGGQVIVSTALTEANHAALRIRDTGVGMSDDDIEVALEPFRQVATSRVAGGTGLGLPLTKALVEANRAFFSIKSKIREGTLVEVVFPPARVVASLK